MRLGDTRREVEADADRRMARGDVGDRHRGALARVYRGKVGMVIPKSKPVAFDVACLFCRRVVGTTPLDEDDSSWWSNEKRDALRCSNSGCDEFGDLVSDVRFTPEDLGARWGHEWALVAWLAENEKRQGVLWEYLDSIRGLCTEADPYTLDTLPEDAMQLLCVSLPDPNECRCRWSGSTREQREQNRSTALCTIHN